MESKEGKNVKRKNRCYKIHDGDRIKGVDVKRKLMKTIFWIGSNIWEILPQKIILKIFGKFYDFGLSFWWRSFVKPGDTVIQVGVDMGKKHRSNVIQISKIVGGTGQVIAIEPDKKNIKKLKKYTQENNINNISIIGKAVWKERGTLSLLLGKESWWNRLEIIPSQDDPRLFVGVCKVKVDTLDNILEENSIKDSSLICLTINGAEPEALEGMHKTLKKGNFTMLIANQEKFRLTVNGISFTKKITSILEKYGFSSRIRKRWIIASKSKNQ